MINQTSLQQPRLPQALPWVAWNIPWQGLLAEPNSRLMKFVTVLVAISALTCVYVWQISTISDIDSATATIKAEAVEIERANAGLLLQVTQWNAPAYIEREAQLQGMAPGRQPVYVAVPEFTRGTPGARTTGDQGAQQLWQRLTRWLPTRAALAFTMQ